MRGGDVGRCRNPDGNLGSFHLKLGKEEKVELVKKRWGGFGGKKGDFGKIKGGNWGFWGENGGIWGRDGEFGGEKWGILGRKMGIWGEIVGNLG